MSRSTPKIRLLLVALLLPALALAQSMTLAEAVDTALRGNEKIRQYEERLKQKKQANKAAWGNFLPTAKVEASYRHLDAPLAIDLDPIREAIITIQAGNQTEMTNIYSLLQGKAPLSAAQRQALNGQYYGALDGLLPPFSETLKKQDYPSAALVGVQPLFVGGKLIAAKKYAAAEEEAAAAELIQVRNQVFKQAANDYFAVALLQQVVATRADVLEGMKRHRLDAQRLFEEGLIPRYHLLRAEVAVADAERNLLDDQNKLDLARIALAHTLGLESASVLLAADTLAYTAAGDSLDALIYSAQENQPLLHLVAMKQRAARQNYAVARSELLPEVAGFGKYELYPEYLSALEPRWVVGIQANWTLFNGLKRMHALQQSVHLEREVEHIQKDARQQVDLWVQKAWRDAANARSRYEKLATTLALADENLRLNDKRFQSGLGTSLEVVDARLSQERIRMERLSSLQAYYSALADIYIAAGKPEALLKVWNRNKQVD
ncbi:MAG TPA: TolC family protein [bacterium]|nr:TolC family protein [bacterium]HQG45003.1 TolC family protein [bacterium]HQI48486.1 TolC family protein [bacterium]HQJ64935.1 TolC family protein [bacterium]